MGIDKEILSTADIHSWSDAPHFYITENCKEKVMKGIIKYSKYHTSWDWLMPVITNILEKCSELDDMERYHCIIDQIPQIDHTYKAVIEFIKYYNNGRK